MVHKILLPVARGVAGNWKDCNRKEAGVLLSHVYGSGKEAHNLVQSFSRVSKKVRLCCLPPLYLDSSHYCCCAIRFADSSSPATRSPYVVSPPKFP
jgi:hypothetical protein